MKSKYSFEKREGYLYLAVLGEYDKTDFLSYPKLIKDECEKEKIYKIIFDGSNVKGTNVPTIDRFFIGEEVANTLGSKIKLAVVWPAEHINKFVETVALNRGAYIWIFSNL